MTFTIVVTVKVVPKPEEVTLNKETMTIDRESADSRLDPACKNAVEQGLQLKDHLDEVGESVEVLALSMGPPLFTEYLQDIVAMGVDDAILLSDPAFAGSDTYPTSRVLASGVRQIGDVDIVLCGEESSDSSTGQVPPGIAEWLDIPQITYVKQAEISNGSITATRTISGGEETVRVPLPAVLSVEYGVNDPRFPNFKRKQWAESEWEVTTYTAQELGLPESVVGQHGSHTEVLGLEPLEGTDRNQEWVEGDVETKVTTVAELLQG